MGQQGNHRALTMRRALAHELSALTRIDAASPGGGWTEASFAQELGLAWSRVEVALAPEPPAPGIVGFVVYWLVEGELQLLNIATDPAHRRRGLGRALMLHLVAVAHAANASRILLEVRRGNEPARALYRAFGFVESGVRRGYYGPEGEDAVLMELTL